MARRPAITVKKTKKPRITKNETYLVNFKYLGDEPTLKDDYTESQYVKSLTWYNYMCTISEARDYIKDYLKSKGRTVELKKFNRVPDSYVPTTAAWIARMMTRGFNIKPNSVSFFETKLQYALSKANDNEETKEEKNTPVINIQQRIKERASDIIGDIEELIDSGEEFSLYDWLKANEIPATYCSTIIQKYTPWLAELIETHEGKDDQLKEAYSHYTKSQLKKRIEFFNTLLSDAERYGNVTKKTRTPRKPRPVSVEKKLKRFKYQKEDNTFKIASINPEKVIGAQELWTFNTKYKIVTVFRAIDRGGLQVKGTSIIGYDEKNSASKGCGRKPEEILSKLQNGGKIILRKLMDELKTDKPLQYRINENTILVRVS